MNTSDRAIISKPGTLVLILLTATVLSLTTFGNTRATDVLILGAAAGLVVFWMNGRSNYIKSPRSVIFPVVIIWTLFFLSSITAASSVPESVLRSVVAVIISGTGIFIIPKVYSRRSFFLHVLSISSALGTLSILAVITPFESVGPVELLRTVPYEQFVIFGPREYAPVPVGGLGNPNTLAITLLPGILVGVNYLRERAAACSTRGVILFGVMSAVSTVALLLTRSRGALLALAAGIVMYVSVHYLASITVRVLCLCGITGTVLFLVPSGIGPIPSLIEAVSAPRAFRWRHALDAILQQPLLGYGVGNSRIIIPELQTQPHNVYFMLGAWSGVGAAIAYLYLFAQTLLLSVRRKVGTTLAVFPAILTSYWVISVFESVDIFHLTIHSIILAITFGFVVADFVSNKQTIASENN